MNFEPILTIIRDVCGRIGLNKPNTATGSTDPQIVQLVAIANKEIYELSRRYDWSILVNECTFLTRASEAQGTVIGDIIPAGQKLRKILNETMWNRTQRNQVPGPLSPQGWQGLKAMTSSPGFWSRYRMRQNVLYFYPAPAAGQTVAFEYVSLSAVLAADGSTYKTQFTADDDESLLDSELVKQGIEWRWAKQKGLDYAEDFSTYEGAVLDAMTGDGTRAPIRMDRNTAETGFSPVIVVPRSSWNL